MGTAACSAKSRNPGKRRVALRYICSLEQSCRESSSQYGVISRYKSNKPPAYAYRLVSGRATVTGMNAYPALPNSTKVRATAPTTASQYRRPFSSDA